MFEMEQERQPFHNRERITFFLNYHEKIIQIKREKQNNYEKYQLYRMKKLKLKKRKFQLEKRKYSNWRKENIPARKMKIFQLEK